MITRMTWIVVVGCLLFVPNVVSAQQVRSVPGQGGSGQGGVVQEEEDEELDGLDVTSDEPEAMRTPAPQGAGGPAVAAFSTPPMRWQPPRNNRQGWYLGVRGANAPQGIRVESVDRNSPAANLGLETGDYIIDVSGYAVGFYNNVYYPLRDVLDRRADRQGMVQLRIWNVRTGRTQDEWVQLDPR